MLQVFFMMNQAQEQMGWGVFLRNTASLSHVLGYRSENCDNSCLERKEQCAGQFNFQKEQLHGLQACHCKKHGHKAALREWETPLTPES